MVNLGSVNTVDCPDSRRERRERCDKLILRGRSPPLLQNPAFNKLGIYLMLGYNRCGSLVSSLFLNVDSYDLTLDHCILSCFPACNYLFLKFPKGKISLSFMGFVKSKRCHADACEHLYTCISLLCPDLQCPLNNNQTTVFSIYTRIYGYNYQFLSLVTGDLSGFCEIYCHLTHRKCHISNFIINYPALIILYQTVTPKWN